MKKELRTDNTIIIDAKTREYTGEVDFEMYDDILGSEKTSELYDDEFGVNTIHKGSEYCDSLPVKIEELKKVIEKFEKAGCNYISIDYNCDHPDYIFYGVDVHKATEEEIEEINNKDKKHKSKQAEELRKKAEEMLNEAKKLEDKI
jgi:hypothetical protein